MSKQVKVNPSKVLVCDHCLTEECAAGRFYCEKYKTAGFKWLTPTTPREDE